MTNAASHPLAVEYPEIKEVLDTKTGEHLSIDRVIGSDYQSAMKLRMSIKNCIEDTPLYRCSMCYVPVYLVSTKERGRFFFRHVRENNSCPAITRGLLNQDQIRAIKYNGAKESALHRKMKEWVAGSLHADIDFQDIHIEPTFHSSITDEVRRPDVYALYKNMRIAFEIQLSTTFLDVIVARREFYLREGALLLWIFAKFDNENRRMTLEDVFYNNNSNAFLVNEDTFNDSVISGKFKLDCAWALPKVNGDLSHLTRRRISFSELTIDKPGQRAYFVDIETIQLQLQEQRTAEADSLRRDFEAWWLNPDINWDTRKKQWRGFSIRLSSQGIQIPRYFGELNETLLHALYSAKYCRCCGWRFRTIIEVAHRVMDTRKHVSWFIHALKKYNHLETVFDNDKTNKLKQKIEHARDEFKREHQLYEPPRQDQPLIEFLFPELVPLP